MAHSDTAKKCRIWLKQHPNDKFARFVESKLKDAEELDRKSEELDLRSLAQVKKEYPVLKDATLSLPYKPTNHSHADIKEIDI